MVTQPKPLTDYGRERPCSEYVDPIGYFGAAPDPGCYACGFAKEDHQ